MPAIMESVLFNDLIMSCISSYMSFSDLKTCRLVCHAWIEFVTPLLSRRCIFKIQSFPSWDKLDITTVPTMHLDPKLARMVRIQGFEGRHRKGKDMSSIINFLEKYSPIIVQLEVQAGSNVAQDLAKVLNSLEFTELTKISILQTDAGGHVPEKLNHEQFFPKLKCIEIALDGYQFFRQPPHPFHSLGQDLINNSCSNLEELIIKDNFYPNLNDCKSLKKLGIDVVSYTFGFNYDDGGSDGEPVRNPEFYLDQVNRMLDEVKDTLEELELGDCSIDHFSAPPPHRDFKLPVMKQLHTLTIMATDLFDNISSFLTLKYLPNLKSLALRACYMEENINTFIDSLDTVMPQVTNLTLYSTDKLSTITNARSVFPNIQKFTLHVYELLYSAPCKETLPPFLEMFKDWELDTLELIIKFKCDLTSVMLATRSLPFDTIKRIKIRLTRKVNVQEDIVTFDTWMAEYPEICEALMATKRMDGFEISGDMSSHPHIDGFREFARIHKLPIYFTYCKQIQVMHDLERF